LSADKVQEMNQALRVVFEGKENAYRFTTPEQRIADFQQDIERWNHENRDA
jgi:TolA-binding protein